MAPLRCGRRTRSADRRPPRAQGSGRSGSLAVAAALLALSCQRAAPPGVAPPDVPDVPEETVIADPPSASGDELAAFARANNAFGLELYAKLRARGAGNLALSPASLSVALAMTAAGARGDTAAQMKRVLHLDDPAAAVRIGRAIVRSAESSEEEVTLRLANRLFGERSYRFDRAYLELVARTGAAPLERLDFKRDPERARRRVNGWVAKETQDRIRELIPSGGITGGTRLVIANAIYFLARWSQPFDKDSTRPAAFYVSPTEVKNVPTMHQKGWFRFASTGGVRLLEAAYLGDTTSMLLVLPDALDGLEAVERRLSAETLRNWLAKVDDRAVLVSLPKFEAAPAAIPLRATLGALGMAAPFDPARADLTGIADPPERDERLFVGDVFHQAMVRVDEQGTEAAAASAVVSVAKGAAASAPPPEFRADHPFLFFLLERRSGAILFAGRVADPDPGAAMTRVKTDPATHEPVGRSRPRQVLDDAPAGRR